MERAQHQLKTTAAAVIEGHPRKEFNGVFHKQAQAHEGWPVLKSSAGLYLYRYEPKNAWRLGGQHRHSEDLCVSHITAANGVLPHAAMNR